MTCPRASLLLIFLSTIIFSNYDRYTSALTCTVFSINERDLTKEEVVVGIVCHHQRSSSLFLC